MTSQEQEICLLTNRVIKLESGLKEVTGFLGQLNAITQNIKDINAKIVIDIQLKGKIETLEQRILTLEKQLKSITEILTLFKEKLEAKKKKWFDI